MQVRDERKGGLVAEHQGSWEKFYIKLLIELYNAELPTDKLPTKQDQRRLKRTLLELFKPFRGRSNTITFPTFDGHNRGEDALLNDDWFKGDEFNECFRSQYAKLLSLIENFVVDEPKHLEFPKDDVEWCQQEISKLKQLVWAKPKEASAGRSRGRPPQSPLYKMMPYFQGQIPATQVETNKDYDFFICPATDNSTVTGSIFDFVIRALMYVMQNPPRFQRCALDGCQRLFQVEGQKKFHHPECRRQPAQLDQQQQHQQFVGLIIGLDFSRLWIASEISDYIRKTKKEFVSSRSVGRYLMNPTVRQLLSNHGIALNAISNGQCMTYRFSEK